MIGIVEKKNMSVFKKAIGLCIALTALVACGEKKVSDSKNLTMLTAADNPPFEFYQTGDDTKEIVGYDIDLAKKIADYLGYTLEIKDVDFSGIIPGLMHGRADFAMAGISATDERKKNVDFSDPYYSANNFILTKSGSDFVQRTKYENNQVGVQLGSTQEEFAKLWVGSRPGVKIISLNKLGDIVQEVLAGRLDGAIMEETPANAYMNSSENKLAIFPLQGNQDGASAIAFPKGSAKRDEFNQALQALKDSGFMDELAKKWLKK